MFCPMSQESVCYVGDLRDEEEVLDPNAVVIYWMRDKINIARTKTRTEYNQGVFQKAGYVTYPDMLRISERINLAFGSKSEVTFRVM